jgi:hypothetical protein
MAFEEKVVEETRWGVSKDPNADLGDSSIKIDSS